MGMQDRYVALSAAELRGVGLWWVCTRCEDVGLLVVMSVWRARGARDFNIGGGVDSNSLLSSWFSQYCDGLSVIIWSATAP